MGPGRGGRPLCATSVLTHVHAPAPAHCVAWFFLPLHAALACAGCLLKYWGLTRKKSYKDSFEMHGFCTPPLHAGCSELAPTVAGQLGDGYRGSGKRLGTDASTQIGKDGPVSRSPGACSTLCDSVPECQYWIVHNTKGRRAWLGFAVAGRAAIGGHGQRVCVGRLMGGPCRA